MVTFLEIVMKKRIDYVWNSHPLLQNLHNEMIVVVVEERMFEYMLVDECLFVFDFHIVVGTQVQKACQMCELEELHNCWWRR
ncbi:hypothetical protein Lalb_Chr25g0281041 [Lupinus albus]|uniref:Uncharacterized protein n=1 Tax=Lupinus albus TaxID=3870 RepID=A0A6A4N6Y4_LUPAL|nr:hypothetical protein Lalb_Chr25g0281041 [Lupinus albus]